MPGWTFVSIVVAMVVAGAVWLLVTEGFVRVAPGRVGLVVKRGRATDTALLPGPHFVPVFRRITIETYPSLELAYRADQPGPLDDTMTAVEHSGPPVRAVLGDRIEATVSYTVRFRLDPDSLRSVHERFGPDGIWAAVRDETAKTIRRALADPARRVDDMFGSGREALESTLGDAVTSALAADGLVVTSFSLSDVDLGRTGQIIQAIARARFELDREDVESTTHAARARNDAALEEHLGSASVDAALRYREVDAWRDLVEFLGDRTMVPAPSRQSGPASNPPTVDEAVSAPLPPVDAA